MKKYIFGEGKPEFYYRQKYGEKWRDYYIANEIIGSPPDYMFTDNKRYLKEARKHRKQLKREGLI